MYTYIYIHIYMHIYIYLYICLSVRLYCGLLQKQLVDVLLGGNHVM